MQQSIDYQELLRNSVLDSENFVSATFSGRQRGGETEWEKVIMRPVFLKDEQYLQIAYRDGRQEFTQNFEYTAALDVVAPLIAAPYNNFFVRTVDEDIQIRITKKGKVMVHRSENVGLQTDFAHNRSKQLPLPENQPDPFLQASGIMTVDGKIKSNKRAKFVQINRFLQIMSETDDLALISHSPLLMLDCGCGSAYLTFAAHHYLNHVMGISTETVGVDVNEKLLARHMETVDAMGWGNIVFEAVNIIDYQPEQEPDIVLALHACDTATDEALAQAIQLNTRLIFSVPCCHHHLQAQLQKQRVEPFVPVMRHNILRERMGDILTDSFRALILRIMGYQTRVIEFVSPEHTAKNLMIRAVHTTSPGDQQFVEEYLKLKAFWNVTPYLETLLGEAFQQFIQEA